MKSSSIIRHNIPRLALSAGVVLSMMGCSDENIFDKPTSGEKNIRFELSTVSFGTRSGSSVRRGGALRLQSDDMDLYLNPNVTPGIYLGSKREVRTRSASSTTATIENFGVYATTANGGLYMNNVLVTRENGWAPEKEYLWPGKEKLTFTAYSPYGIVSEDGDRKHIIDYTVPKSVKNQQDILWATQTTVDASPCELTFNHALSAIRFVTGAEMVPCTVKSISISGVPSKGVLDISDGSWSSVSTPADYSVVPAEPQLSASGSDKYVAAGTSITADDETFLLIPGTLPADATVTLVIDIYGKESDFTASIGGQEWPEGSTVTYRLSAKPETNRLILDVIGTFETPYPGQTVPFQVKSCYIDEAGDSVPVSWKAEFVDADGNVIGTPEWIKQFPASGEGLDYTKAVTKMQKLTFAKLSAESQKLQDSPDINSTSGQTPFNLSNSTGAKVIENTANCYVINAPGKYSFPLVYGNAIKNGADNKEAYTSSSHNRYALKTFVNHLNNAITSPYIYENQGCGEPKDAILVWEGRLDLIRNVSLNADRTISFEVPAESIRQGNAIIALRDKNGAVMWSWNIWVTDYVPGTDIATFTDSGNTYRYYPRNIGRIMGGDITVFPHCEATVRFTQTGGIPDGMEPLTTKVLLNQTGITTETIDCYNFYQWGRKDPIKSSMNEWFDAEHYEIKAFRTESLELKVSGNDFISVFIKNPDVFFTGAHDYSFPYTNLWDSSLSTSGVKTIYDPCPVGSKVPYGNGLIALIKGKPEFGPAINGTHAPGLYFNIDSGARIFFPELGYRSGQSGSEVGGYGANGTIWLAQPGGASLGQREAGSIVMDNNAAHQQHNPRLHGFGVRPILE